MNIIEQDIFGLLKTKGLTLGSVESATGGLISHRLTNVPGISDFYKGGITAYANETKVNIIGVKTSTLNRYGAVSPQVAEEMAAGGKCTLDVDICIADTGIAGPGGATPEKPLGLFYLGLAHGNVVNSSRHIFSGGREDVKALAAEAALAWLKEYLESLG